MLSFQYILGFVLAVVFFGNVYLLILYFVYCQVYCVFQFGAI